MKRIFCDVSKNVFLKVCASADQAEREVIGAKMLGKYAIVPEYSFLDSKTLAVTTIPGVRASLADEISLGRLIKDYLVRLEPVMGLATDLTIWFHFERLRRQFYDDNRLLTLLGKIELSISDLALFPVHGDLQRQNVFLVDGRLGLIDFEHFILAPVELELVNSLFFQDSNCLDLAAILPRLVACGKLQVELLQTMFLFYSLKQLAAGRPSLEVRVRYRSGACRLEGVLGKKLSWLSLPGVLSRPRGIIPTSSCFL